MKITKVTLYKLPINNTYENVLDFAQTNNVTKYMYAASISSIFTDFYLAYEHSTEQHKHINGNRKEVVTLDYQSETSTATIYNYNYAIIEIDEQEPLFYFITDFKINNSLNNVTIYLEWDSWGNNIDNICNNTHTGHVIRRVDNRPDSITYNGDNIQVKYNNKNIRETNIDTGKKMTKIVDNMLSNASTYVLYNNRRYIVLWQRRFLDSDTDLYTNKSATGNTETDYIRNEQEGAIPNLYPIRVIYIPVALVDYETREISKDIQYWRFLSSYSSSGYSERLPLQYAGIVDPFTKWHTGVSIINVDLTFSSPFRGFTQIKNVDGFLTFEPQNPLDNCIGYYLDNNIRIYGVTSIKNIPNSVIFGGNTPTEINVQYIKTFSKSELSTIYESTDDNISAIINPHINLYPYKYYSLLAGTKKIDLTGGEDIHTYYYKPYNFNKLNTMLKVATNVNYSDINSVTDYEYINNNGTVIFSTDSLAEFLRANAVSLQVSGGIATMTSLLGIIGAGLTGGATAGLIAGGAALSGVSKLANIGATIADVDNQRDHYRNTENIGTNDTEFQDSIVVTQTEQMNYIDKMRHLKNIIEFGIMRDIESRPLSAMNANYDYVIADDVTLRGVTNIEDNRIISNRISRGLRTWHLDTCNINALLTNLSKKYCNLTLELYNFMIS